MEQILSRAEELAAHVKKYINNHVSTLKLRAAEKSSKLISAMIAFSAAAVVFLFFLVFAGIAAAYALAEWTGKLYWGFLLAAGIYLALGIFIWMAKEKLIRLPVMNALLH